MPLKFAKPESRAAEKKDARKFREAHRRIIYRLVTKREKGQCRVPTCKEPGRHHHHIRFRSRGGADETKNIVLLCPEHHADVHGYRLHIEGLDADHTLRFTRAK